MKRSTVPPEPIGSGKRWINWTAEKQPIGRTRKVPYSPYTHEPIDVTDNGNGSGYELAASWKPNRLGLLIFPPLVAIDLDLAISEKTGEVEAWAQEIVSRINSYTEISPSGLGLHILAMGIIGSDGNRKKHVEIYSNKRFITFTGKHLQGTPNRVEKRFAEVKALWNEMFPGTSAQTMAATSRSPFALRKQDKHVLATALEHSDQFARLFEGDSSGYRSPSEADLAFCSLLSKFTSDPDQVDGIFRTSRLMRSKWDRESYRQQTLVKAFQKNYKLLSPTTFLSPTTVDSLLVHEELLARYGLGRLPSKTEFALWANRLRIEKGELKPAQVTLRGLDPKDDSPTLRRVHAGFKLLLECHWLRFHGKPVLMSKRFAAKWCGVGSPTSAWRAIQRLMECGYIYVDKEKPGSKFGDTPMYLPVTDPSQVKVWRRPSVSEPPDDWSPG